MPANTRKRPLCLFTKKTSLQEESDDIAVSDVKQDGETKDEEEQTFQSLADLANFDKALKSEERCAISSRVKSEAGQSQSIAPQPRSFWIGLWTILVHRRCWCRYQADCKKLRVRTHMLESRVFLATIIDRLKSRINVSDFNSFMVSAIKLDLTPVKLAGLLYARDNDEIKTLSTKPTIDSTTNNDDDTNHKINKTTNNYPKLTRVSE